MQKKMKKKKMSPAHIFRTKDEVASENEDDNYISQLEREPKKEDDGDW